jgi:hypothetical protein
MGFATIDPHSQKGEGTAIQGMSRISNGYFTGQLFKEWGILLYLIPIRRHPIRRTIYYW